MKTYYSKALDKKVTIPEKEEERTELVVIDYGRCSQETLMAICEKNDASIENWTAKEYGTKIWITAPQSRESALRRDIKTNANFSIEL